MKELLDNGAVQVAANDETTPLIRAADKGLDKIVHLLLTQSTAGIDLQIEDNKYTALHRAAARDHQRTVSELLQAGANPDIQDRHLFTPLMLACQEGNTEVVKILLGKGANIKLHNKYGFFPIHRAAARNCADVVKILLNHKCDPDTVSKVCQIQSISIEELLQPYPVTNLYLFLPV